MERLPLGDLEKIALPLDLINFCNNDITRDICEDPKFWEKK